MSRVGSAATVLGRGGLQGALVGIALTLAEVVTGGLAGGRLPPRFWLFLGLYYVSACSLAGVLTTGVAAILRVRKPPGTELSVVAHCVFLLASAAAILQEWLPEQSIAPSPGMKSPHRQQ